MGVSVLRVAACAGLLVGVLLLSDSAAGIAVADPGGAGHRPSDEQSSKAVTNEHPALSHIIRRIFSEHRMRAGSSARSAPQATIGSATDSSSIASESNGATIFADADDATDPEGTPPGTNGTEPAGVDLVTNVEAAGGSELADSVVVTDNAAVAAAPEPAPARQQVIEYPFLYYLLEVRRGGSGWWNATIIISRRQQVVSQPTPEPEPEVVPRPAFRGPAPEAPAPEPVLDASGGVAGGSDYQGTGFVGAPVLSAPVVAAPVVPPAAARFPSFPPAGTSASGVGTAAARGTKGVDGPTAGGVRTAGPRQQAPVGTVKAMSGQAPRQGYTDYLRRPALPQLAGAALPGVAGILLMTLGGGVIGYRQASAGRMIRAGGAARYLP
ncbi:MAG: hypothetical protein QOJ24_3114 [Mycobacterium sp.]|jgi:hypothetical protein|nr:hypothetical protein [Mycobacterium sp.]